MTVQAAIVGGLAVAVAVFAARRKRDAPLATKREWAMVFKILFSIGAAMLMITLKNAVALPAAQFIYGRF